MGKLFRSVPLVPPGIVDDDFVWIDGVDDEIGEILDTPITVTTPTPAKKDPRAGCSDVAAWKKHVAEVVRAVERFNRGLSDVDWSLNLYDFLIGDWLFRAEEWVEVIHRLEKCVDLPDATPLSVQPPVEDELYIFYQPGPESSASVFKDRKIRAERSLSLVAAVTEMGLEDDTALQHIKFFV